MLGSITPLGERGRGSRWGGTVAAFVLSSVAAGLGLGAVLGRVGGELWTATRIGPEARLAALGVATAVGLTLDGRLLGVALPTVRRQVNEEWLDRYRGWVYGTGFGFQLGLGFFTIASLSAVYLTYGAAFLSGTAGRGAAVGATFGLIRAAPVLATRRIEGTGQLMRIDARLRRWDRPSFRLALAAEAALAVAALVGAVG